MNANHAVAPPTKHQLALMIWIAVFPTLTVINLTLADVLRSMGTVQRTFVLATVAVPIVIYGLMPQLHKLRIRILARATSHSPPSSGCPSLSGSCPKTLG